LSIGVQTAVVLIVARIFAALVWVVAGVGWASVGIGVGVEFEVIAGVVVRSHVVAGEAGEFNGAHGGG
jgi:hypothetical protein